MIVPFRIQRRLTFDFFYLLFFLAESIAVEFTTSVGTVVGASNGRHVEHPGALQMASVLGRYVADSRPRRFHTGGSRKDYRNAGSFQVSEKN